MPRNRMLKTNRRIIILTLIVLGVFIFIAAWIHHFIVENISEDSSNRALDRAKSPVSEKPSSSLQTQTEIQPFKEKLIVDDPAQYGIIVEPEDSEPRLPVEFDKHMERVLIKSGVLQDERTKTVLKKIRKTSEESQADLEEIDRKISTLEKAASENPDDEDIREELQSLYMLQSLHKVLSKEDTPLP